MKKAGKGVLILLVIIVTGLLVWKSTRAPGVASDAGYSGLEKAMNSQDVQTRMSAVKMLLDCPSDEAGRLLLVPASDRATVIRVAIVQRIKTFPVKSSAPVLLKLLDDRESGIVRDAVEIVETITGKQYGYQTTLDSSKKQKIVDQCKADVKNVSARLKRE